MPAPLMISGRDNVLTGVARRSDPLGVLAIWSARAREAVPHLTEQTTDVRGFQILVEAFRLWTIFADRTPQPPRRLGEFFMLVEQAFARTIGYRDRDWHLPGARRVRGRMGDAPCISVEDARWHLLGGQLANGIWGLYRGASRRSGLLEENMAWLSEDTLETANATSHLQGRPLERMLELVGAAMGGATVELPTHGNNALFGALCRTFDEVPLKRHLHAKLIDGHDLNRALANRLVSVEKLDHRAFFQQAILELEEHGPVLNSVIDCENLIAVLEGIFFRMCNARGVSLEKAADSLPLDLDDVRMARDAFANSGASPRHTADRRQARLHETLDTSSVKKLACSVLSLHKAVSDERQRSVWVWEEHGILRGDSDVYEPSDNDLKVSLAWRNDYYLYPLWSIARQLAELGT